MTWSAEDLLRVASASPQRVAEHDRAGWLALFAREAEVEDPVGAPVHRRAPGGPASTEDDPLARFYDTFIGPNEIRFEVHADAFATLAVTRHVTIHTCLEGGLALRIPAYLLYDLVEESGHLKIRRLAAHWSVGRASLAGLPSRLGALRSALGQTARLIRNQGLHGTAAYSVGLVGNLASSASPLLAQFAAAVNQGNGEALAALLGHGDLRTAHAATPEVTPEDLIRALSRPGPFVAAEPIATARSLAFRFRSGPADTDPNGIALLEREGAPSARHWSWRTFAC